ncbi:MAG: FecR family protein [Bacteroidales bacterium]|nr:FecR family protein [Bacteroidales bacterium]
MSLNEFKGWERIDGSAVSTEETNESFSAVMKAAKSIENDYISKKVRERAIRVRRLIAAAAVVVLLIVVPISAYFYLNTEGDNPEPTAQYSAPKGQISEIVLSDGTKVILNAGSTLSYPDNFGRVRQVSLTGEAVFYVSASKIRPFIVSTETLQVRAHGTVFSVCDYPEDEQASATLCSGKISVNRNNENESHLNIDQIFKYEKATGATSIMEIDADEVISWKDGELRIKSLSLNQVMKIIERRYDVNVHITTAAYNNAVLTIKFLNGESLEQVMEAISRLIPGMSYSIEDHDLYIR